MQIDSVLAGVAVSDLDRARDWYTRFFGRSPDAEPMPGLAEWHLPAMVQIILDPDRAGGSILTIAVPDAARALDQIAERAGPEIELDSVSSVYVHFARTTDPDGNAVNVVGWKPTS